jgi:hypothetical protein
MDNAWVDYQEDPQICLWMPSGGQGTLIFTRSGRWGYADLEHSEGESPLGWVRWGDLFDTLDAMLTQADEYMRETLKQMVDTHGIREDVEEEK